MLKRDKNSSAFIMDQQDYVTRFCRPIQEGINNDVSAPRNDINLKDLQLFQSFFCRNFKKQVHYEQMHPFANPPPRLYGAAKIH